MMSEMVEFLKARLDEDEKDFTLPRPHTFSSADAYHGAHRLDCASLLIGGTGTHDLDCDCGHPARAIRDVAAKRAILEIAVAGFGDYYFDGISWDIVQHLTATYSDHPDYQQRWAVDPIHTASSQLP